MPKTKGCILQAGWGLGKWWECFLGSGPAHRACYCCQRCKRAFLHHTQKMRPRQCCGLARGFIPQASRAANLLSRTQFSCQVLRVWRHPRVESSCTAIRGHSTVRDNCILPNKTSFTKHCSGDAKNKINKTAQFGGRGIMGLKEWRVLKSLPQNSHFKYIITKHCVGGERKMGNQMKKALRKTTTTTTLFCF